MSDDCFDLAEEIDRLRLEIKRLEIMKDAYKAESERMTAQLDHVMKDWYNAADAYGLKLKCQHFSFRRPDQPCPECFTSPYLVTYTPPKATFWWGDMTPEKNAGTTDQWVRDRFFVLDGHPTLVYAWRKV